jgi:uncharacterized protein (TIGR02246 family)
MQSDEQAIRDVIAAWLRASTAGDLETVLSLMTDDVVFLTPGQKPFGKDAFAAASRASQGKVRIETSSDIKEIQVAGDMAYCRHHLAVSLMSHAGGSAKRLAGNILSVFRKQADGRWVLARDANLLMPVKTTSGIESAVVVLRVASVAKSMFWYREVLDFEADPFGCADDPVFAILRRDGVEIMLMKLSHEGGRSRCVTNTEGSWDVYIRVADVHGLRRVIQSRLPNVGPIRSKEYGCQECALIDPDGHVLVLGQCESPLGSS